MAKPTYQDAMVILQIGQLWTTSGASKAFNWLWSDEFIPDYATFIEKYLRGSEGWLNAFLLLKHYETIGALWKHGLIHEELLFDTWGIAFVWDRIKGFVLGERERTGFRGYGANFEAVAKAEAMRAEKGKTRRRSSSKEGAQRARRS